MFRRLYAELDNNHNATLIHSLEAYTLQSDRLDEAAHISACESIGAHIEYHARLVRNNLKNLLHAIRFKGELGTINQRITEILHDMVSRGRVLDQDRLAKGHFTQYLTYTDLIKRLEARTRLFEAVHSMLALPVPSDQDAYHACIAKILSITKSLEPITGLEYDVNSHINRTKNYFPTNPGSLKQLGYDDIAKFYKIHELVKSMEPLWQKWQDTTKAVDNYGTSSSKTSPSNPLGAKIKAVIDHIFTEWAWWDFRLETNYAINVMHAMVMSTKRAKP